MIKIAICDDENIFTEKCMDIMNNIRKEKGYNIEAVTFNSGEDLIKYIIINEFT
ncbi:hypothetical protein [Clostridium sp.]|uniref:hypothetical protein n=1 Tax=Clostridium sp. TaxID=1506 RepID=UPI003F2FA1DE